MVRALASIAVVIALATPAEATDDRALLARARALYNMRDFDGAIATAEQARGTVERSDSTDLIAARALLERYRASAVPDDLVKARELLRRVASESFVGQERLEFVIGLGETLYFDGAPGAAAAIFDTVLDSAEGPHADERDLVLDWWASAVDQDARPRSEFERQELYGRVRTRMRAELGQRPSSATAAYWTVASARGQGDLQGAWAAAQAAWVRASLATADRAAALRGDLDRLMLRAVIPERARLIGQPPETLRGDWDAFKEKWNR